MTCPVNDGGLGQAVHLPEEWRTIPNWAFPPALGPPADAGVFCAISSFSQHASDLVISPHVEAF